MACDTPEGMYRVALPCAWCLRQVEFFISPEVPMPPLWMCPYCSKTTAVQLASFRPPGFEEGESPTMEVQITPEKQDDPQS